MASPVSTHVHSGLSARISTRRKSGLRSSTLALALLLFEVSATVAQTQERRSPAPPAVAPHSAAPQTTPTNMPVTLEQALYLIRSTLLTLNDANRSGNYSVLRDVAAPDFQSRNTAADLAMTFADLRRRNFNLFAVALTAPQLTAPPSLDANGMLRLTGFFPTQPLQIRFDLLFQESAGQWRLFGIAVSTPEAPPPPQAQATSKGPPAKSGAKVAPKGDER
jgi:hypothetical protein